MCTLVARAAAAVPATRPLDRFCACAGLTWTEVRVLAGTRAVHALFRPQRPMGKLGQWYLFYITPRGNQSMYRKIAGGLER